MNLGGLGWLKRMKMELCLFRGVSEVEGRRRITLALRYFH